MKTEILTAACMLALIALLILSQSAANGRVAAPSNSTQTSHPIANTNNLPNPLHRAGETTSARPSSPATAATDADDSNQVIRRAARAIAELPPLRARLRYKINMFGEKFGGPGHYYQKGQGTRLARIQFQFGSGDDAVELHQLCDGDFLYSLSVVGHTHHLEFVDLRQLGEVQSGVPSPNNVNSWLSVGSLSGLMEQLSEHFDFKTARSGQLGGIPVIQLSGRWKSNSLVRLLEGQMEPTRPGEDIDWQAIPRHIPHQVRLTLGNDDRFPLFPYRIEFQHVWGNAPETNERTIAELELFEVQHVPGLPDTMFQLPSVDAQSIDATEFYKQRVLQFTR